MLPKGIPIPTMLLALGIAACAPKDEGETVCAPCPPGPAPKPVRIALLGDRTGHPDDDIFFGVLGEIRRLRPDVIVSLGDLIEGYQPDARLLDARAEWDALLPRLRKVTGDTPFFASPGNHDVWSDRSEALFTERLGHPVNHSFAVGAARIILFDTSRVASESAVPEEDLEWLWRALYTARHAAARVVITHRPLWAIGDGGRYGAPLHDVLIAGRADLVITGHWHHAMSDERNGVRYRMLGPSGASLNRPSHPESGNLQQFGLLTADADGVELSVVAAGAVTPGDRFPYRLNQIEYKIEHTSVTPVGFDISARAPADTGRLVLAVTNVTGAPLETTLSFKETRWRVTPSRQTISLAPNEHRVLRFGFRRAPGDPFPGPRLEMPVPWPEGGRYVVDKTIAPTLTHRIPRVAAAPVVDGLPDDLQWQRSPPIRRFFDREGPPIEGRTEIRALVADDTLFLAARMGEADMAGQPETPRERDRFLEEGDHLRVWLNPDPSTRDYFRITASASGAVADRRMGGTETDREAAAWNGVRSVKTAQTPEGWTLEMAIPLRALGTTGGDRLGFNVARGRWRGELSRIYWQPLLAQDRDSFGALLLR